MLETLCTYFYGFFFVFFINALVTMESQPLPWLLTREGGSMAPSLLKFGFWDSIEDIGRSALFRRRFHCYTRTERQVRGSSFLFE